MFSIKRKSRRVLRVEIVQGESKPKLHINWLEWKIATAFMVQFLQVVASVYLVATIPTSGHSARFKKSKRFKWVFAGYFYYAIAKLICTWKRRLTAMVQWCGVADNVVDWKLFPECRNSFERLLLDYIYCRWFFKS